MIYDYIRTNKSKRLIIPVSVVAVFILINTFLFNIPKFTYYDAYFNLGEFSLAEEKYDEAIDYYNKSLFYKDDYETYLNIGSAFALKKDFKNAVNAFTKALTRNPSDPMIHFNLGYVYTQQNNFELAINSFNRVIEIDSNFTGAYRNAGIIYYLQENWATALDYFEKFLSLSDDEEINNSVRFDVEQIKIKLKESESGKSDEN
jgi:tetratricopeptide (TPR) repeat protein